MREGNPQRRTKNHANRSQQMGTEDDDDDYGDDDGDDEEDWNCKVQGERQERESASSCENEGEEKKNAWS